MLFPLPHLHMIRVEGHTKGEFFYMGGDVGDWEKPIHQVSISNDYYICKFQVTQALYQEIMHENPAHFKGVNRPVEMVRWEDVTEQFLPALNVHEKVQKKLEEEGIADWAFRLPTEAEWEYAARGGKYSQGYKYSGSDKLKQVGWYNDNSGGETKEVGLLLPNELGLYDMSGNVWEWCADWYSGKYCQECYDKGTVKNPKGPDTGGYRVMRGGGCFSFAVNCRSAYRSFWRPATATALSACVWFCLPNPVCKSKG